MKIGTYTKRLLNYPFERREFFFKNGRDIGIYKSPRVGALEMDGILSFIKVDIDGTENWWYLNEYQTNILLDNPTLELDMILSLLKFEYAKKKH